MELNKSAGSRLMFIDMARSFAIVFMLEGHFITLTYGDYFEIHEAIKQYGASGNFFLDTWHDLRNYTAPLFFTITGLVLGYLLMGHKGESFWKQKRVSKGWRRGLKIILWGYILQINLEYVSSYFNGTHSGHIYTFHVLQCIGTGLLLLIALYGIHYLFKKIKFSLILFIAGVTVFALYPVIRSYGDTPFPSGAPLIIQNMLNGPNSVFPIIPHVGFIFFGASIGSFFREYAKYTKKVWFPAVFVASALLIILIIRSITIGIALNIDSPYEFIGGLWLYKRVTYVVIFIGILMYVEYFTKFHPKWFIQMGQNTLNIYIIHCILLYGSIFGFGIKNFYNKNPEHGVPLSFGEAVFGAVLFVAFFAVITHYRYQIKNTLLYIPRLVFPNLMKS